MHTTSNLMFCLQIIAFFYSVLFEKFQRCCSIHSIIFEVSLFNV